MNTNTKRTVVLIHGAWMIPASWDRFRERFEGAGYEVLTPPWPYLDGPIEEFRKKPPENFAKLTIGKIADSYQAIIKDLKEPPLLVGHSFGGLIVQLLLDRGVGSAGVAIDPGPIAGVIPDFISLSAALPVILRFNGWNRPFVLTRKAFDSRFANTAPKELRETEYARLVVPCPGPIFYQAAFWLGTGVKPKTRQQPLLVVSGDEDKTVAPYLARAIYNKQKKSPARTDFKNFAGRSHFLIAEPGWEEVADYAIGWAKQVERHQSSRVP